MLNNEVIVIGAGLAGSEAAWQIANSGVPVKLVEMRPIKSTPAHHTDEFGELVCSNSFGALSPDRAGTANLSAVLTINELKALSSCCNKPEARSGLKAPKLLLQTNSANSLV